MEAHRVVAAVSGAVIFCFGMLKLVDPFRGWYAVQIEASGMGSTAYVAGIVGEVVAGGVVFSLSLWALRLSPRLRRVVLSAALLAIAAMMAVAVYVHLHPGVPAHVLPLNIKAPYIPVVFMVVALLNVLAVWRHR